jgi:predicted flap endonuclease-1-like 5' DNA nuclease
MFWVAIIVVVVIGVLLLWWWLGRCPEEAEKTRSAARPSAEILPPAPAWRSGGTAAEPDTTARVIRTPTPERVVTVEVPPPMAAAAVETPPPAVEPEPAPQPSKPDDLKVIEGIGPKISAMLNAQGIYTFAQLAATDVERLRGIMLAANLRIADPTTWPQQAALAAAGKWDELKALQDSLKGGRKA